MHLPINDITPIGWWHPGRSAPESGADAFQTGLLQVSRPLYIVDHDGRPAISQDGAITIGAAKPPAPDALPLLGYAPALHPRDLGDPDFKKAHQLEYAYVVGAMANGITSVEMVEAAGRAGMVGFFGAAGLLPDQIKGAIHTLQQRLAMHPFGFNLIHSPADPDLEAATVNLYLHHGIKLISASAYLGLTLPLVYYRVSNLYRDRNRRVVCPNRIIAKVSRVPIAALIYSRVPLTTRQATVPDEPSPAPCAVYR